jgi:predicted aspartyl protease
MSIIRLPLRFEGSKGEKVLYALFDSGANLSCINEEFANEIANLEPFLHPRRLATASEHHFIEINSRISTDFYLNDVHLSDEFLVVPTLSEEVIIGASTMQKWRIKLDFDTDSVIVDPKVAKLQLIRINIK